MDKYRAAERQPMQEGEAGNPKSEIGNPKEIRKYK
jgi:hypothetical protein